MCQSDDGTIVAGWLAGFMINNNNDAFCANIFEGQTQWRDKTKGLSKLVIVKQCVSRQWMDEEARRLRRRRQH